MAHSGEKWLTTGSYLPGHTWWERVTDSARIILELGIPGGSWNQGIISVKKVNYLIGFGRSGCQISHKDRLEICIMVQTWKSIQQSVVSRTAVNDVKLHERDGTKLKDQLEQNGSLSRSVEANSRYSMCFGIKRNSMRAWRTQRRSVELESSTGIEKTYKRGRCVHRECRREIRSNMGNDKVERWYCFNMSMHRYHTGVVNVL